MRRSIPHALLLRLATIALILIGLALLAFAARSAPAAATQPAAALWNDVAEGAFADQGERLIVPASYRTLVLDESGLQALLAAAPWERTRAADAGLVELALPLPRGGFERFRIVESPIMAPELAAKFPEIRTYAGQGIDRPSSTVRFDVTPQGFHAMILSVDGRIFIDPYSRDDTAHYISYFAHEAAASAAERLQGARTDFIDDPTMRAEVERLVAEGRAAGTLVPSGDELRTYRTAVAATGEYTAFHGGTVPLGQAAIVTAINRVTGLYEIELAIRLELIANNDTIVYTNAGSDPYTNNNPGALLNENQANLDSVIGSANYDIGHVFTTGGGGLAGLGVVCTAGQKARGETGLPNPIGDPFYVDFVAHEMGHQFGGNHTFNGNESNCSGGNRNASTAYEPGSGSTIQAYAGICGSQNLQTNSDAYFHTISFDEMVAYSTLGNGNSCPVVTATGNGAPVPDAGAGGFVIPIDTPFELIGSATDPDGDTSLTYNWEQYDLGPAGAPGSPSGDAPIFRSWPATMSPTRVFPRLSDLVNNTTVIGELLPGYTRNLTFRLTVRDNQLGGGGVDYDTVSFTSSAAAGPFLVTAPNTTVTWTGTDTETVTWDVAGTSAAPVSCANVDITLSEDGGFTYPHTVLTGTPNDGTQSITVPNINTTQARVKVKCADNIFFDISNIDFTINESTTPDFTITGTPSSLDACQPGDAIFTVDVGSVAGFSGMVDLSVSGTPAGATAGFSVDPVMAAGSSVLTIGNAGAATAGTYPLVISGSGSTGVHTDTVTLNLLAGAPGATALTSPANGATDVSVTPSFSWSAVGTATSYQIQVAEEPTFTTIVISETVGTNSYTAIAPLNNGTAYYWHVTALNSCGSSVASSTFAFTTPASPTCTNVLVEGGFEGGPNVGWSDSSSNGFELIDTNNVRTGTYAARLGGSSSENSQIWQSAAIDSGATSATLTYYYFNAGQEQACDLQDVGNMQINSVVTHQYDLCSANNIGAYQASASADMLSYAGTSPEIRFQAITDSDNRRSSLFIDDVSLEVCQDTCFAPAAPTDLAVAASGNDAVLSWTDTGADGYEVWWGTNDPYFTPGLDCAAAANCAEVVTNGYTHVGAVGGTPDNFTYVIVAVNSCGAAAFNSNRSAEFDFAITPGTP